MTIETAYLPHDHSACINAALERAAALCEQKGLRLTAQRRQVLALIWQSHKPVGAYDVLAMLSEGQKRPAAPPTVYRALDFLLEQGLIHRIASLNAFIGCSCSENVDGAHDSMFLICEKCRATKELAIPSIAALQAEVKNTGFQTKRAMMEITGLCPNCQAENTDA